MDQQMEGSFGKWIQESERMKSGKTSTVLYRFPFPFSSRLENTGKFFTFPNRK